MASKPFLLISLGLCLIGCQYGPDQQLVGAWTTNRRLTKLPEFPFPDLRKRIENGIYATQLKLSADHTFVLSGLRQVGGKWSYAKGQITLEPAIDPKQGQTKLPMQIRQLTVEPDFNQMTVTVPLPFGQLVLVLDKTA